jgi:hypothetical protein
MKMIPFLFLSAVAILSVSCASTSGRNPYQYSEGKLGAQKTVSATSMDGRFLFLSDGSIWNVDWADSRAASRLNSGDAVTVSRGNSNEYPYEIAPGRGPSISARLGKKLD